MGPGSRMTSEDSLAQPRCDEQDLPRTHLDMGGDDRRMEYLEVDSRRQPQGEVTDYSRPIVFFDAIKDALRRTSAISIWKSI
ncbi:hypothetical protein BDR06DRAFT_1012300 [Suillus hirtellus]|nr:hypothetical protein BDR06DRAFT_1012300 [Suillus hirtellus]